jgi:hypothetical protein
MRNPARCRANGLSGPGGARIRACRDRETFEPLALRRASEAAPVQGGIQRRAFDSKPCRTGSGGAVKRGCLHCGGPRFESPPLHQEVRANRRDFRV